MPFLCVAAVEARAHTWQLPLWGSLQIVSRIRASTAGTTPWIFPYLFLQEPGREATRVRGMLG